jgi:hypothetical protein
VSAGVCRFPITDSHDQEPTVYRHELVRALMRTVPCWKSFQPPAASTRNASNVPLAVIANGDPVVAQKRMSKHRALEYWRLLVRVARSIRPYGIDHPFDLKA